MIKYHDRDCFYKYVTADVAKDILNNLLVKCSSPLLFDDPFDSQIEIQHDVTSNEELIKRSIFGISELMKPILKDGDAATARELTFDEIMADPKFVTDRQLAFERFYTDVNKFILELAREDRIFCISEKNDNLLMWAHYADKHKGIVIKFKCFPEKETALCAAKPVIYSDKVPLLTVEDLFKGKEAITKYILNEILLTKSKDWDYESEWRVILKRQDQNKDYDLRSIFEEEIEAVYLGCCVKPEDKKEIVDIIKTKRKMIKIFESLKDKHRFGLSFKELI